MHVYTIAVNENSLSTDQSIAFRKCFTKRDSKLDTGTRLFSNAFHPSMDPHTYPGKGLSLPQLVFALNEELKHAAYNSPLYVGDSRPRGMRS